MLVNPVRHIKRMQGVGMIEILITVVLISFGVLAMAHLHASSFRYVKMAQFRGIATQLAFEMSDRMRANTSSAVAGSYAFTTTYDPDAAAVTVPTCAATTCTGAEIAAIDMAEMRNTIRLSLPGGGLRITQDTAQTNVLNVWIVWLDPETLGNSDGDTTTMMQCPFTSTPAPMCLAMRTAL